LYKFKEEAEEIKFGVNSLFQSVV